MIPLPPLPRMTRSREFEELRALLFSIAYRIIGSVSEAEDAVQETWLRYGASAAEPVSAKAFLSATVTRVSIDVLRSARVRRVGLGEGGLLLPSLDTEAMLGVLAAAGISATSGLAYVSSSVPGIAGGEGAAIDTHPRRRGRLPNGPGLH